MDETLLTLILGLVGLAAVYGVSRWAAWLEQRARDRRLSDLVYYPKRGGMETLRAPTDD